MQKARQAALLQETNNAIISIRSMEMNYYVSFFNSFCVQSMVIGGFVYSVNRDWTLQYTESTWKSNVYILISFFLGVNSSFFPLRWLWKNCASSKRHIYGRRLLPATAYAYFVSFAWNSCLLVLAFVLVLTMFPLWTRTTPLLSPVGSSLRRLRIGARAVLDGLCLLASCKAVKPVQ